MPVLKAIGISGVKRVSNAAMRLQKSVNSCDSALDISLISSTSTMTLFKTVESKDLIDYSNAERDKPNLHCL